MGRRYWLVKSDPETFSWEDLERSPGRSTCWDGVRNFQARNFLRDEMKRGDGVLFYHSQTDKAVMGLARVGTEAYPDPTQFDKRHNGYDPASTAENPRWFAVDLVAERRLRRAVTLDAMRCETGLERLLLLRKGSRLSVQPLSPAEWKIVIRMGDRKP